MPSGTPKYFKRLYTYEDPITPDSPEFEAKMRQLVGKEYQDTIDKTKAGNVATPKDQYSLMGFNTEDRKYSELPDRYKGLEGLESLVEQGKHVFGVGAGASPRIFAHEFRHNKVHDEAANRVADLINSPSLPAYEHNIAFLYGEVGKDDNLKHKANTVDDPTDLPLKQMEQELLPYVRSHYNIRFNDHIAINQGKYEPELIDKGLNKVGVGDLVKDYGPHKQVVPKSLIKDRADYPALHFMGTVENPSDWEATKKAAEDEAKDQNAAIASLKSALKEATDKANKKAVGGTIELPNNYRAGGRTRIL